MKPRHQHTAISALVCLLLFGCAIPENIKPGTPSAEVIAALGQPHDKSRLGDGTERWEYAYGPEGVTTWVFMIDRGGKVTRSDQLLTPENLNRIEPGVTRAEEVRQILGKPREIAKLAGETVWEWRVSLAPEYGVYVVRFDERGVVTGKNVLPDFLMDSPDP